MNSAQKGPRGGDTPNAAGNIGQQQSYDLARTLQERGWYAAELIREIEERFLAALWNAPPCKGYGRSLAAGVDDAALFAFREHGELFRVLMAFGSMYAVEPSISFVRDVAKAAFGRDFNGLDGFDDLPRVRWRESTAAALEVYGGLIALAARKRLQLARLIRRGIAIARDPLESDLPRPTIYAATTVSPPSSRRFSSRAFARVFGEAMA